MSPSLSERPVLPASFVACLPLLWRRVLFPGTPTDAQPLRWQALLLLILLPAALLYPCLSFHLFEPDEGRYAEIPREMLLRGEWIVPYLQGEPYLDKPPLLYWLIMASYRLFGVDDWSARLVPALAVHGCILLTYLLGRRPLGERTAFWGAVILSLAPGFVGVGRLLVLDGVLTLWVWLSLLAALRAIQGDQLHRGSWLLTAAACGLGVLTKGPIAVLLLVPPLLVHRLLTGNAARIGWRGWLAFAAVVTAINLPWYVAVTLREPSFPRYFFWEHNVVRFLSPFDHLQPVWYYGPILLGGLLPGTLLLPAFLRFLSSAKPEDLARRTAPLGFFLLAGGWCVLFFSLSGCKLPTYILPAFPALSLALGAFVAGSRWETSRWPKLAGAATFGLLVAAHTVAVPWYAEHRSPLGRPDDLLRHCADPETPLVCYPRPCDSVAFYLGRDDLVNFRSKQTNYLILFMQQRPKTVVLFTHRHSLDALKPALPPELRVTHEARLFGSAKFGPGGDCLMAVVEQTASGRREPAGSASSRR